MKPLKRPVRRGLLVAHVAVSVSRLGLTVGLPALGTPWGLARHRWVWTTFWLTLITTGLSIFSLRPGIDAAAADGAVDINLVIAPSVATGAYLFITAISILKPWGLTPRGRRLRFSASSAKSVDARSPRQTA
ncbi:DUF2269 domain-containing protein [Streptomyces sp. WA6-1-16]|uniref:DUF2269 domain-containing protein n=1 Tax=Streptomyces sp. WA6-1-16 TaxID=2879427 RepID=UPI001CE25490|nr:DUF2269 domain-containing protein [Streptomyces sp. WA6-1-16]UCA47784.1 DUF2269 domain-containing protein [Streptomyces sp. WA6-1-16]